MKGIDVSIFNGNVDWQAVKAAGFDFAICRSSYGKKHFDESFQRNVEGAHRAGLFCGAYHYSYALTPNDAVEEAQYCKWLIENCGVFLELPVFFDMEDGDGYKSYHGFNFRRRNVTDICHAFLENIKPLNCGVYASLSWLEDLIDWQSLNCPIWNAQYYKRDFFQGYMWQFTDNFIIAGKSFDANILYDDVDKPAPLC